MSSRTNENQNRLSISRRRGFLRAVIILVVAALVAALISTFGLARQYGYLRASLLSGPPTGAYYDLATHLAERAKKEEGGPIPVSTFRSLHKNNPLSAG